MRTRNVCLTVLIGSGLVIAFATLHASAAAGMGNANPGVLPPNSRPHGRTYAGWSTKWWQWAFSLPIDHHPLFDTADVSTGQSGSVWFLGGTFVSTANGKADRTCTVPAGKALFFPLINSECSQAEGSGSDEATLGACAMSAFADADVPLLFCEVDGVPLQDLGQYRTPSPLFTYSAPAGSILATEGFPDAVESTPSVGDGYYVMLAPLSAGKHTIHFGGTFTVFGGFTVEATYHITVQ